MAFNLCSLRCSLFSVPPHPWLIASVVGSIALTAAIMWSSQVRESLGVGLPSVEGIEVVVFIALAITLLSEGVKTVLRRMATSPRRTTAVGRPA